MRTFILFKDLQFGQGSVGTSHFCFTQHQLVAQKLGLESSEGSVAHSAVPDAALSWGLEGESNWNSYAWSFHIAAWLPRSVVAGLQASQ